MGTRGSEEQGIGCEGRGNEGTCFLEERTKFVAVVEKWTPTTK